MTETEKIEKIESKIQKYDSEISFFKSLAFTFVILGFCLIFFFQYKLLIGTPEEKDLIDKLGSISGGIVSSTFSLAGLFLVYVAFIGQKQQLLHQQIELELTRNEMKNQQLEMKRQNETLEIQKFENLFFQLISTYQNTKASFYVLNETNLFLLLITHIKRRLDSNSYISIDDPRVLKSYVEMKSHIKFDSSFLLQTNSILKFIFENTNDSINSDLYLEIFNSTLSLPEIKCINLIYHFDSDLNAEIKNNIEKSNILKRIEIKNYL